VGEEIQRLIVAALYVSEARGTPSLPVSELRLRVGHGVVGDRHTGPTRVRGNGEVVTNLRQFTIVSSEELGRAASALGAPYIDPAWINANLCLTGPAAAALTTTLVPGTLLLATDGQPLLRIEGVTEPCVEAGAMIASQFPHLPIDGKRFPKAAMGLRGVFGAVVQDGTIAIGDRLAVSLPR
jgi:hypothetical protein